MVEWHHNVQDLRTVDTNCVSSRYGSASLQQRSMYNLYTMSDGMAFYRARFGRANTTARSPTSFSLAPSLDLIQRDCIAFRPRPATNSVLSALRSGLCMIWKTTSRYKLKHLIRHSESPNPSLHPRGQSRHAEDQRSVLHGLVVASYGVRTRSRYCHMHGKPCGE
jgi:hypothetical protein